MTAGRPQRPTLSRADLPDQFTPETVRDIPIAVLRRLADHRNGVLSREEQRAFDHSLHAVMRDTAQRVLSSADWAAVRRDRNVRGRTRGPASRAEQQLDRLTRQIGEQVSLAGTLAPGVDWSFAQPESPTPNAPTPEAPNPEAPNPATPSPKPEPVEVADAADGPTDTVPELEQRITEQVELVSVMSEIADVSRRTYALEQQRDLQNTRTVFFGFVVSVAVLVAGWAPLVAAHDWSERLWVIGLTVGTCLIAAAVYYLVRRRQRRDDARTADDAGTADDVETADDANTAGA